MANILLADDGIEFNGLTLNHSPLGGVESSIIHLTTEFAKRGHRVQVRNKCIKSLDHLGVEWRPIDQGRWPDKVDLYIANRGDKLINRMPNASKTVFWIHNPAHYLLKWRYLNKLWSTKPTIVFIGAYHASTYPKWAPGGQRIIIPYGIPDIFCDVKLKKNVPQKRAIFTSNPLRSLDWLLQLWANRIQPRIVGAELHLFSGVKTYGSFGDKKAKEIDQIISKAKSYSSQGVFVRDPATKLQLVEEFNLARCMLYRGDLDETFCLAVGEAQASGVPAVVRNLGSVVERIEDKKTGFVAQSDDDFVKKTIEIMSDDKLWCFQHKNALDIQRSWRWSDAAALFESLMIQGKDL